MAKEIIKIPGTSYNIIVCDEFLDILKQSIKYEPLRWSQPKVEKAIGKVIKAGLIELNVWNTLIAYWKRYNILLTVGYYDPYEDIIFINLPAIGIKVSKDCGIYTKPTSSMLQNMSNIIAHELIHYVFQNHITSIYSFIRQKLITFFKTFWSHVFNEEIYVQVAESNFATSLDMNINIVDKDLAIVAKNNYLRFLSILERFSSSIYVKDRKLLEEIINLSRAILDGRYIQPSPKLEQAFRESYISIYEAFPLDLAFGQEIIFASEILSRSTDTKSTKAKLTIRRLLNAIEV